MGTSRKRQSSPSSSSTSDSASDSSMSASPSRSKDEKTPPPRRKNNNQSPRRQSFNTTYNSNTSLNTSHNRSQNNKSMSTPSKYVGGDRAGLEPYLIERKRRKEERDAEKDNRAKEEKRTEERKSRDRKMKPDKAEEKKDPTAPNYEKSGKLTEDRNTYKGIVIKYSEPPEARIPKTKWRLYPFKGEETLPTMYIHRNSGYLIGRERKVVDIPADHPSCSSQHAVVQFRLVDHIRADGSQTKKVKPYVMDLESTNGSFLNNVKIEPRRYYELKERDIIKFGFSTREYVLLHERSEGVMDTES